ncbi:MULTISPECIES: xanthine dehydrogenase family protein molybdopterin-binding subunit [unclassified Beijerinckia]|uniref:xanthine dehydrogenase family protein molybdopterin-binding subunit n=1 Tax=unclassified Beijerinckia TaxID=2638183 RepID=UPI00147DB8BD|nr:MULTISPECIES: xanthine dehydrogenase family protein molybdopterin-binding subunit [unclassified Beijerinckia]
MRRKEDVRLLTGKGQYTDDINIEGQAWAAFVRSSHANATINGVDTSEALAAPGVIAVYTGLDLDAAGVGTLLNEATYKNRDGSPMHKPVRKVMPTAQTRFVGEVLAIVIAETANLAREAADLVQFDFDPLPAIASTARALDEDAPKVWPEFGTNLIVHWEYGDEAQVEAKLNAAHTRVKVDLVNNRVAPSPMEPRCVVATYEAQDNQLTVYSPTQGGRRLQAMLAENLLHMPVDNVRIVSRDTGGGFGVRSKMYPETVAIAFATKALNRPVKWRGDRVETFMSDYHGRDQINHAEMGLDADGKIVALKLETLLNVGAYLSENGVRLPMEGGGRIIPCTYHVPDFYFSVKPMFTNTVCTDTYRGAGRPEANYITERLMDAAADATGLSIEEIRRRNFISQEQMPYRTHLGFTIDSGDFAGTMDMATKAAHWDSFPERRKQSEAHGKLRGIGLAVFIEGAGSRPMEGMRLRFEDNGDVSVIAGTYSHGQGHETVYSQLVTEWLGVDYDKVKLINGDTGTAPKTSVGTFGSRSSMVGGGGIRRAANLIIAKGRKIAGHLLQADADAVKFADGVFRAGASSMTIQEVAAAARDPKKLPDGLTPGLDEEVTYKNDVENFPNGAHVVEVEVDPDTGVVVIVAYTAVDDCGVVLNPFIVHGQVYGGVAQGVGQALIENVVYDEDGQLLTASYMDYGMPRAHTMAHVEALFNVVPAKTNELGVKGAGEAGATGAPAAVVSAVCDALKPYGIRHLDMPLTPELIWRAIRAARADKAA